MQSRGRDTRATGWQLATGNLCLRTNRLQQPDLLKQDDQHQDREDAQQDQELFALMELVGSADSQLAELFLLLGETLSVAGGAEALSVGLDQLVAGEHARAVAASRHVGCAFLGVGAVAGLAPVAEGVFVSLGVGDVLAANAAGLGGLRLSRRGGGGDGGSLL